MIEKVGINLNEKYKAKAIRSNITHPSEKLAAQGKTGLDFKNVSSEFLNNYFVSFKGRAGENEKTSNSLDSKLKFIRDNSTPKSDEILARATKLAKDNNYKEVNQLHVLRVVLEDISEHIDMLNSGEIMYDDLTAFASPNVLEDTIDESILKTEDKRNLIKPIIDDEIKILDKVIKTQKSDSVQKQTPSLSKDFANEILSRFKSANTGDDHDGDGLVQDDMIFDASIFPLNDKIRNMYTQPFLTKLKDAIILDNKPLSKRVHISFYDEKAKNLWKNLAVGTNMVILHDKKANPKYLITSFLHVFENTKNGFGSLNKNTADVAIINNTDDIDYLKSKINTASKDKSKTHIFVLDITDKKLDQLALTEENIEYFNRTPKNIKFVMVADKDVYYSQSSNDETSEFFQNFGEVQLPILNIELAKKVFHEEPALMEKVKKSFSIRAIDKVIEASSALPGHYPEKAQKVFDLISSYYIDKNRDINLADVQAYIREAKEVFKNSENDSSIRVIFDTGIKLKDLVGTPTTKKEAKTITDRIKDRSIGTKGYIIYTQDGSVGGGRKYTAKAIAGETKSPYIEINAWDFGTKDVDLFGGGNMTPEKSMKKLFGLVKTQAETAPHKSAVIFIENFEYFASGELVSEFHQKAMAQLLREMDSASKQGLNILVMGSTSDPTAVDGSTSKSFKFIDMLEIESPAVSEKARKEIIEYYIKKKGIRLAGKNDADKQKILEHVAATTKFFSYIEILTLLDKAKNVAKERNHKSIESIDFTEAFLQLTTGRPAVAQMEPHSKEIVTSHECGHAVTGTVMYNLLLKTGRLWAVPDRVNFITLDPRGWYGGAVYYKDSQNHEVSFDSIFARIVSAFGGYSCENTFFGMDGSLGIQSDMKMATDSASEAVGIYGQGKHFGKKSLDGAWILSEDDKRRFNRDVKVILKNAETVSNLIVSTYEPFIKEFTAKYKSRVGTGECLIKGDIFEKELEDWTQRQPQSVKDSIQLMEKIILDIIQNTKNGKEY